MDNHLKAAVASLSMALMLSAIFAPCALAYRYPVFGVNPYAYRNPYYNYNPYYGGAYYGSAYYGSVFNRHPIVSGAAIGGVVGALGGATVGALGSEHKRIGRDALVGASGGLVLGAGVGLLRNKMLYGYW